MMLSILTPTAFDIKEAEASPIVTTQNAIDDTYEASAKASPANGTSQSEPLKSAGNASPRILSQSNGEVKNNISDVNLRENKNKKDVAPLVAKTVQKRQALKSEGTTSKDSITPIPKMSSTPFRQTAKYKLQYKMSTNIKRYLIP